MIKEAYNLGVQEAFEKLAERAGLEDSFRGWLKANGKADVAKKLDGSWPATPEGRRKYGLKHGKDWSAFIKTQDLYFQKKYPDYMSMPSKS